MTLRESDDRIVPMKLECQSSGQKPGNAGVGKAVRASREVAGPPLAHSGQSRCSAYGFSAFPMRQRRSVARTGYSVSKFQRYGSGPGGDWAHCRKSRRWSLGAGCWKAARPDLRGAEGQLVMVRIL